MKKNQINAIYIKKPTTQDGQVIMAAVMMFLTLSIVVIVGIALPISSQVKNGALALQTRRGIIAADAVNDEALYRLNSGRTLPASIVLGLNQATATAQIIDTGTGKEILTLGEAGTTDRYSKAVFTQSAGLAITYGVQTGTGGLQMSGGPTVYGNVYANGNIVASGGSTITGTAVSASMYELEDQVNIGSSGTPWGFQDVGKSSNVQTIAQSFMVSTSTPITSIDVYVKKNGAPANATIRIYNNNGGTVGTTQQGSNASLSAAMVGNSYGWVKTYMYSPITLQPNTLYWLTIQYSGNNTKYYTFGLTNDEYADGSMKLKNNTGSYYNPGTATQDMYFRIYTGGVSTISGINIGGDANAAIVNSSNISGNLYCQSGTSNNKSCNTTQPLPNYAPIPVIDSMIDGWVAEASAGTVRNSTWNLGGATATSTPGPMRINGDLIVGGGATLTLRGPLYVTGLFKIEGGAVVRLDPSYGTDDEVIVANNFKLSGGGVLNGSGQSGSYVTLVAKGTDAGEYAGIAEGGTSAVIYVAPNGTMKFSGGATAKASVANKIIMEGGTTLTYEAGLASLSFAQGASGAWNVDSWKEVSN